MSTRIKDIAARAKVSQATVSLVLNNKPGVGKDTRERILRIARQMDYGVPHAATVSPTASTIQFLKIAMHGHTVNRDHNVFISDYIDGLTRGASVYGHKLEINSFRGAPAEDIVQSTKNSTSVGIIVLGTELSADEIETIASIRIPMLFLDTYYDFLPYDFVDMNNKDAVHTIITHLVENGHEDIGFVRSAVNTHNFHLREEGFWKVVEKLGIQIRQRSIFTVDSTYDGAYSDMLELLEKRSHLPSCLFVSNDIMAYGCLRALNEKGLSVPEDMSIVGFDDLPSSALMKPALTTMEVSKRLMGEKAVELLSNRIRAGESMPPVKIQIGGNLVVRDSVRNLNG